MGPFPATIALLPAKTSNVDSRLNFDFNDGPFGPSVALRVGDVGIVAVLQDWGAMMRQPPLGLRRAGRLDALAPLQFKEVAAVVRYTATLLNWRPTLAIETGGGIATVRCLPISASPSTSLYDEFDGDLYTSLLAHALEVDVEVVRPEPGRFMTWLVDGEAPRDIPFESWPGRLDPGGYP